MAVQYKQYEDKLGRDRVLAYSDLGFKIERDGKTYSSADDWAWQEREYTETDIPIELREPDNARLTALESTVAQHSEDIEANAEAIQELGEILGGE